MSAAKPAAPWRLNFITVFAPATGQFPLRLAGEGRGHKL
jgi:hypothetical protein